MRRNLSRRACALVMSAILFGSVLSGGMKSEAAVGDTVKIQEENMVQASYSTISSDEAYDKMMAMQDKYPTGTPWTNADTYKWNCGWSAAGCMGFAHLISDAAFGNAGMRTIYASDVENVWDVIRVGDVLRIENNGHSVIVLEKHSDYVVVCEGNASGKVRWGRTLTKSYLNDGGCYYIETRYGADMVTMTVESKTSSVYLGETYKMSVLFTPVSTNATVKWSSSNPDVVEVAEDGSVTGKSAGYAIVTAECEEMGMVSTCIVECIDEKHKGITIYNGVDYGNVYDYDYYIEHNPDIKRAFGNDEKAALNHFVNWGMAEGRRANEEFDVYIYKNMYADLRRAFGENLTKYYWHYNGWGKNEGRIATCENASAVYKGVDYSNVYDYDYYVEHNPDIKRAYGDDKEAALNHFVNWGMAEGRQASEEFNVKVYKNLYADLQRAFGSDLKKYYLHYNGWGKNEGRTATGEVPPATIYDGVDYSKVYDYNYYVTYNPDIKRAFGDDDEAALWHFVNWGMAEGRRAKETFDVNTYKNTYVDLQRAYGDDLPKYYIHYVMQGYKENRVTY